MKCHRCSRMHSGDTSKVLSKQVWNCLRVCYCSLIKGYNRCGRCRILSRYFVDSDEDLGGWCANCDGRDNSSKTPAEPSLRCSGHGHELVKKSPNNGRPHDTVEGKKKKAARFSWTAGIQCTFHHGTRRLGNWPEVLGMDWITPKWKTSEKYVVASL